MIDKKVKQNIEKWNSDDFKEALKDGKIEAYTGKTTLHFISSDIDRNTLAYQNMIGDNGRKIGYHTAIELIEQITQKIKDIESNLQHIYG
ncbi:hypothetical protein GQ472_06750 [archaeon]|nr:hypothetical protein [archaeon]